MRKNSKIMFLAILLLGVGFAAVSTTLYMGGTVGITTNDEDFSVVFTKAVLDGEDVSSTVISADGKTITYGTNEMSMLGDKSTLDFEVTNNSEMYDAEVSIECVAEGEKNSYYTITKEVAEEIVAKTTEAGKVEVELTTATVEDITESFTCTLTAQAKERTTKGEAPQLGFVPTNFGFGQYANSDELLAASTTDYTTLGHNLFAGVGTDNSLGVCINDGGLFCMKVNDYENTVASMKAHFGEDNCAGGGSSFYYDGEDFYCTANSEGGVYCYDNATGARCTVSADGSVYCYG